MLPLGTSLHLEKERTRGEDCFRGPRRSGEREKKCKRRGQWREKCTGKLGSLSFSNSPTRLYGLRQKQLLVIFPGG